MKKWYNEYRGNWRIHDYFSLMINQFPIMVIRRMDNPHDEDPGVFIIGFFGFTWTIERPLKKPKPQNNIHDRLKSGVNKYGFRSDFTKEYTLLCDQLRYDELDSFLRKWDV